MLEEEKEGTTSEQTTEEQKIEVAPEKEPEKEEVKEPELPFEAKQALQLFNALKDPTQAPLLIKALAESAGYTIETHSGKKEVKQSITSFVKEQLGDDFELLASKLGPVLETAISSAVQAAVSPVYQQIKDREIITAKQEIDAAFDKIGEEFKDFDKYDKQVSSLMDEIDRKSGQSAYKYIKRLYQIAKSEDLEAERLKATVSKIDANAKKPSIKSGVSNIDRIKEGSINVGIREAVLAAMKGQKLE